MANRKIAHHRLSNQRSSRSERRRPGRMAWGGLRSNHRQNALRVPVAAPKIAHRRISNWRPLCRRVEMPYSTPTGTSTLTIGMWPVAAPRNKSASVNKCRTSINPQSNTAEVRNVGTVYQGSEEAIEHRPFHHRLPALLRLRSPSSPQLASIFDQAQSQNLALTPSPLLLGGILRGAKLRLRPSFEYGAAGDLSCRRPARDVPRAMARIHRGPWLGSATRGGRSCCR